MIFHDGRLVKRPMPKTALLILLWIPLGISLAIFRTLIFILPMRAMFYVYGIFGIKIIVKGNPPPAASNSNSGVLFACNHRSVTDAPVLCAVLQRRVPVLAYSVSRISEIMSPIPTIRLA